MAKLFREELAKTESLTCSKHRTELIINHKSKSHNVLICRCVFAETMIIITDSGYNDIRKVSLHHYANPQCIDNAIMHINKLSQHVLSTIPRT